MSNSRNLASLGTIVTSTSAKNVSFANNIANGFATATSTNTVSLNVTGNSSLTYIAANNSLGTAGQILISGGSTTNVSWSSFNTLLNYSTIALSNTITFNNTATYNSNVTFANTVTFSNPLTIANINATYIANSTFSNYKEQSYSNGTFGSSYTIDLTQGTMHLLTLTSSTTIYMPTAVAGKSCTVVINTGSGNYTVTWNGVSWTDGAAPATTTTSSKKDVFSFISDGVTWLGFISGQNF